MPLHTSLDTFLGVYYQRLRKRIEHKQANVALTRRILDIMYHLLIIFRGIDNASLAFFIPV